MADNNQGFASISFESDQWLKVLKKLERKWDYLIAGQSPLRKEYAGIVSVHVYSDIIDHFRKQRGPNGPWDKWSDSYSDTIAGKIAFRYVNGRTIPITDPEFLSKNKPPRKPGLILQDSGRLRQSISPTNFRLKNEGILFYNDAKTKDGFPYAEHHDKGKSSWKGNPRPFMWLSPKGINGIIETTVQWLKEGFGK